MGKLMRNTGAEPDDLREVLCFPHVEAGSGRLTLHEDDGLTTAYQQGSFADVALEVRSEGAALHLSVSAEGEFTLPYREVTWVLPQGELRTLHRVKEIDADASGRRRAVSKVSVGRQQSGL